MADDNAADVSLAVTMEERQAEHDAAEHEERAATTAATRAPARPAPAAAAAPPAGRGRGRGGGRGRGALASAFAGLRGGTPATTAAAPAASSTAVVPRPAASTAPPVPHPDVAASKARTEEGRLARLRELAMQQRVPSEMEKQADPADLALIRKHYGNGAQMIITLLLTMDAYFVCFWIGHTRIGFKCPMPAREAHALPMCRAGAHNCTLLASTYAKHTHLCCLHRYRLSRDDGASDDVQFEIVVPSYFLDARAACCASNWLPSRGFY